MKRWHADDADSIADERGSKPKRLKAGSGEILKSCLLIRVLIRAEIRVIRVPLF
jgi:hypothetical protein